MYNVVDHDFWHIITCAVKVKYVPTLLSNWFSSAFNCWECKCGVIVLSCHLEAAIVMHLNRLCASRNDDDDVVVNCENISVFQH